MPAYPGGHLRSCLLVGRTPLFLISHLHGLSSSCSLDWKRKSNRGRAEEMLTPSLLLHMDQFAPHPPPFTVPEEKVRGRHTWQAFLHQVLWHRPSLACLFGPQNNNSVEKKSASQKRKAILYSGVLRPQLRFQMQPTASLHATWSSALHPAHK